MRRVPSALGTQDGLRSLSLKRGVRLGLKNSPHLSRSISVHNVTGENEREGSRKRVKGGAEVVEITDGRW